VPHEFHTAAASAATGWRYCKVRRNNDFVVAKFLISSDCEKEMFGLSAGLSEPNLGKNARLESAKEGSGARVGFLRAKAITLLRAKTITLKRGARRPDVEIRI
jgi:hypothetical protein